MLSAHRVSYLMLWASAGRNPAGAFRLFLAWRLSAANEV
jgi:hypothetical protein